MSWFKNRLDFLNQFVTEAERNIIFASIQFIVIWQKSNNFWLNTTHQVILLGLKYGTEKVCLFSKF